MSVSRLTITSAAAAVLAAVFTGPALAAPEAGHPPRLAVPVPAAARSASTTTVNYLAAVSCAGASFCMAVGSNGPAPAAQVWNGSIWRALSVPVRGSLTGVSCLSARKCLVVGDGRSSGVFGQWWNGRTWRTAHLLSPAEAFISGVSCVTASMCIAAGSSGSSGFGHAMSQAWNGSGWRLLNTPDSGGPESALTGVSCTSRLNCMAVGAEMPDNESSQALAVQWNGTSWTLLPTPGGSTFNLPPALFGVSCLSSSDCMAVGQGGGSNGGAPFAVHWDGSAWTELSTPGTGAWAGVSCVSGGNCVAVGASPNVVGEQPLAAEWDGGTWQSLNAANPGPTDFLYGISCTSGVNCLAVGSYGAPAGASLALAETWDGGTWQVPAGSTGYLALTPDGQVSSFHTSWYGSERGHLPSRTAAIGITPYQAPTQIPNCCGTNQNGGYLILNSDGGVANFNAPWYGSERGHRDGAPAAITADPATGGYWIVNANGVVHNYNAPWYGSERGKLRGTRAISIAADPVTGGYWILNANGGIASFHAPWLGSERGHVTSPPVALVYDSQSDGDVYVILGANGSIASFGHAAIYGGKTNGHATGLAFDSQTGGYWVIYASGRIVSIHAPWFGSLARKTTRAPVGIAGF